MYGVLIGRVIETFQERDYDRPHYGLIIETDGRRNYEVKINVRSRDRNMPDLLYIADDDYDAHAINILPTMPFGFHEINYHSKLHPEIAVDYIRSGLFNPKKMKIVPHTQPGESNDLNDFIDQYMSKAKREKDSTVVYVYGMHYDNGIGVHDVHMMQGNTRYQPNENGTYHDGCVLVHYKSEDKWTAYFLAFQSQSWCTDDRGRPKDGSVDGNGNPIGNCTYKTVDVQREEPQPIS
ncbi:YukJ family protein [Paenibacillus ehimensis]|uniref:YukJ family protein n=1 Tax=Paenibacillus ehimensis TaxID=79264 RepID=A0ABT8VIM3_9BACL|nr:YukJ family protein [Paenibacillus ehimensis]MDO3680817.1 YukJ family protein [Paenibacillus ehimensis]MEC0213120.1 YukJ family protein [Paenibacillus ehimensis]